MSTLEKGSGESLDVEDRSRDTTPDYFFEEFVEKLPSGGRVLDAGCGTGYLSKKLSEQGLEVVSVDIDEDRLEKGKELDRFQKARKADIKDLGLDSESFDGVVAVEVIEHLEQPQRFVEEAYRVLKYGGVFAVKTPNRLTHDIFQVLVNRKLKLLKGGKIEFHPGVMLPGELVQLLEEKGFRTEYVKARGLPENQVKKLGKLSKPLRFVDFRYVPRLLQPTVMVTGEKK